jgi:hypothetical protein
MQGFLVERKTLSDFIAAYPHSPENQTLSFQEYLEDMRDNGFELVTYSWYDTSFMDLVFKVVAK